MVEYELPHNSLADALQKLHSPTIFGMIEGKIAEIFRGLNYFVKGSYTVSRPGIRNAFEAQGRFSQRTRKKRELILEESMIGAP